MSNETLRETLLFQPKHGYDWMDTEERLRMEQYAEEYKTFLNAARTEREAVKLAIEMAESRGFTAYAPGMPMQPGTKVYFNNRDKALILAVISAAFMIPVLMEFAQTGLVPRFPTLIACCVTMLAALLLFISGLILSTLQEKDKRDFEFELQQVGDQYRRLVREETAKGEKISA